MILAVDPGKTTGAVLVYRLSGQLAVKAEVLTFGHSFGPIDPLLDRGLIERVIVERPPQNPDDPNLPTLFGAIWQTAANRGLPVNILLPGEWKPIAKQLKWKPHPDLSSRHSRDAYLMARHQLRKEGKL